MTCVHGISCRFGVCMVVSKEYWGKLYCASMLSAWILFGGINSLSTCQQARPVAIPKVAVNTYDELLMNLQSIGLNVKGEQFGGCESCIVYLPDFHYSDAQERSVRVIKNIFDVVPVGVVGVEGIDGVVTDEVVRRVLLAESVSEQCSAKMEDMYVALRNVPSWNGIKLAKLYGSFYIADALVSREWMVDETCIGVAPGRKYVLDLAQMSDCAVFGVETGDLYSQSVNICFGSAVQFGLNELRQVQFVSFPLKDGSFPNADAMKLLGEYKDRIKQYESSLLRDLEYFKRMTGLEDFENARRVHGDLIVEKRSHVAVENLRVLMNDRGIQFGILVYGSGHESTIIDSCRSVRQNYVRVE